MRQLLPNGLSSELERNCEYYQQRMERRLVKTVHDKERIDDICQETFLRAWECNLRQDTTLLQIQTDYHLGNWLCIIAERIAIDENRRKKPISYLSMLESDTEELVVDGPEKEICERDRLRQVLAEMSLKHQQCVQLIDDGYEKEDIAERLSVSLSEVSKILRDVRARLQSEYYLATVAPKRALASEKIRRSIIQRYWDGLMEFEVFENELFNMKYEEFKRALMELQRMDFEEEMLSDNQFTEEVIWRIDDDYWCKV